MILSCSQRAGYINLSSVICHALASPGQPKFRDYREVIRQLQHPILPDVIFFDRNGGSCKKIIECAGRDSFGFGTHGVSKELIHCSGGRIMHGGYTLIIAIDLSDDRGFSVGSSSRYRQARALSGRQQVEIASDDPGTVLLI